jgi:hypothetical protein
VTARYLLLLLFSSWFSYFVSISKCILRQASLRQSQRHALAFMCINPLSVCTLRRTWIEETPHLELVWFSSKSLGSIWLAQLWSTCAICRFISGLRVSVFSDPFWGLLEQDLVIWSNPAISSKGLREKVIHANLGTANTNFFATADPIVACVLLTLVGAVFNWPAL